MGDEKKWTWKLPKNIPKGTLKKDQLLIILLVGILLLVIAVPTGKSKKDTTGAAENTSDTAVGNGQATDDAYVSYMEKHLEEMLSQMSGVGRVTVMITLKSSTEKVVEKDIEKDSETVTEDDSQGGNRSTQSTTHGEATVYTGGTGESQSPYISKEISPQVEGVVVLASGGDNAVVIKNITEAVQALFSIDTHKIKIMKRN